MARPPREGRGVTESPVVVVNVSFLGLARVRSFFCFETSPHCEMVPEIEKVSGEERFACGARIARALAAGRKEATLR